MEFQWIVNRENKNIISIDIAREVEESFSVGHINHQQTSKWPSPWILCYEYQPAAATVLQS